MILAKNINKEKQKDFEKIISGLEDVRDGLGKGLDQQIKNTVAYLNLLGFYTTSSCEGHTTETKYPRFPHLHISAPDQPKFRFENEENIRNKIAENYKIEVETIEYGKNKEAGLELDKRLSEQKETEEFKKWS